MTDFKSETDKIHKYIKVVLGEYSHIEIEVSGSRDLINKLDIAIHNIIEKEENKNGL